jgi:hypothetical protein
MDVKHQAQNSKTTAAECVTKANEQLMSQHPKGYV